MQDQDKETKKMLVRAKIQSTCFEIIRTELKGEKGLDEKDILFISSLFKLISDGIHEDPEMLPREHHVFCDEVAKVMSEISVTETYTKGDVKEIVMAFSKAPYNYVVTNDRKRFEGFRATDYFVDLICENIGLEFY